MRRHATVALLCLAALCGIATPQAAPRLVLRSGHCDAITALAFSPDGRRLASVSRDATLKVWDIPTRELIHDLHADQGALLALAFTPDGERIATAGSRGTVALWDATTLARQRLESVGDGPVPALAFSPDGTRLAMATWRPEEHMIILADPDRGAVGPPLVAPGGEPRALAFSPDGSLLALGVTGQTAGRNLVELWDVRTARRVRVLPSARRAATSVAFTPDGRLLAATSPEGAIDVWDPSSGTRIAQMTLDGPLHALAFAAEGRVFAVAGEREGRIASLTSASGQRRLQTAGAVNAVAWSPDGTVLAGGDSLGNIALWSPTGAAVATFPAREAWHWQPAFLADGTLTVQGGQSLKGSAWLAWDARTCALRGVPPAEACGPRADTQGRIVSAVAADGSGRLIASSTAEGRIEIRDRRTGRITIRLAGHAGTVPTLAFAPQGDLLASGGRDGTVRLWNASDGRLLLRLGAGAPVNGVAVSLDGTRVAAATGRAEGSAGRALLWDLGAGASPRVIESSGGEPRCVAFSLHGTALAVGSADAVTRLYDTRSGELLRVFEGHGDGVWGVAMSPDGTLLASGSRDGTVGIWDARTGTRLLTWTTGRGPLVGMPRQWIAFDASGYYTGSEHAASLVGWRTGDEIERTDRFAHLFFRPDLIERALRTAP